MTSWLNQNLSNNNMQIVSMLDDAYDMVCMCMCVCVCVCVSTTKPHCV